MHFVFDMDGVICTPAKGVQFGIVEYVENCKPIANVSEFMHWLKKSNHLIIIWCNRPNDLAVKLTTEKWLELKSDTLFLKWNIMKQYLLLIVMILLELN